MIFIYLLAIFIGFLVTVTPIMNGRNSLVLGTIKTSFYHYFFALVTGMILMLILSPMVTGIELDNISIKYFMGGILGLSIIVMMNYYAVRIKAIHIAILPFLGQMTMGFFLDYLLFGNLDLKTILGMTVVILGLFIQSSGKP